MLMDDKLFLLLFLWKYTIVIGDGSVREFSLFYIYVSLICSVAIEGSMREFSLFYKCMSITFNEYSVSIYDLGFYFFSP